MEVELGKHIRYGSTSVILFRSALEELLEHVKEPVILFGIDSRIFDDQATIGMQGFCYGFTVLMIVT